MRGGLPLLCVLALLIPGCTSPAGPEAPAAGVASGAPDASDDVLPQAVNATPGSSGGVVGNAPPRIAAFSADRTQGANDGTFTVVFTGEAFDGNTEHQLTTLAVGSAGAGTLGATHVLTPAEKLATAEPEAFGPDGFKAWTGTPNDGVLHFRYRLSFPSFSPAGEYAFVARAVDAPAAEGASSPVVVTLQKFSLITVSPHPVDASGAPLPGARWGQWNAVPGASNVASANYLKLVNDGDLDAAVVVVSFSEAAFVGVDDRNFSIPISGNVEFAFFEDATPALTSPQEGTFAFAPAPAGAVTVPFTAKGNVVYVAYRVVKLPDVLPAQAYGTAYTVTEL